MSNNSKVTVERDIMDSLKKSPLTMQELCILRKEVSLWDMGKSIRKLTLFGYIQPETLLELRGQSISSMGWNYSHVRYQLTDLGIQFTFGSLLDRLHLNELRKKHIITTISEVKAWQAELDEFEEKMFSDEVDIEDEEEVQTNPMENHTRPLGPTTPKDHVVYWKDEEYHPTSINHVGELQPFDIVRMSGDFYTFMGVCGTDKSAANYPTTPKGNLHVRPLGGEHGPTLPPKMVDELRQIGSLDVWRKAETKKVFAHLTKYSYYTEVNYSQDDRSGMQATFEYKQVNGVFYWLTIKNTLNKGKARMTDAEFNDFLRSLV